MVDHELSLKLLSLCPAGVACAGYVVCLGRCRPGGARLPYHEPDRPALPASRRRMWVFPLHPLPRPCVPLQHDAIICSPSRRLRHNKRV
ncbi:hypothetical protein SXCC_04551 [Gluconacetobacter sp. SXCC-1]|nr:hypothetical protein SXCC_04551 [Gluconacetobacter sp. SXCC-1]